MLGAAVANGDVDWRLMALCRDPERTHLWFTEGKKSWHAKRESEQASELCRTQCLAFDQCLRFATAPVTTPTDGGFVKRFPEWVGVTIAGWTAPSERRATGKTGAHNQAWANTHPAALPDFVERCANGCRGRGLQQGRVLSVLQRRPAAGADCPASGC